MNRFAKQPLPPVRILLISILGMGFILSAISCDRKVADSLVFQEEISLTQSLAGYFSEAKDLNDLALEDPAIDRTMSMISIQLEGMLEETPAYTKATHFVLSHPFDPAKASCLHSPEHVSL